jgi:hypothetical protein
MNIILTGVIAAVLFMGLTYVISAIGSLAKLMTRRKAA